MQTRPRNSKVKQPSRQQSKPLKKKVSHIHNNTTRTHIPAVKTTAPSSLGPAAGLWLAPDPLLTPSVTARPLPFPQQICPRTLGVPGPRPGGPRARGREATGGSAPPGTCSSPGSSGGGVRDPRGRSGPFSALPALRALGQVPTPPPTHREPSASEDPLPPGAGRTYHMQLHLGTNASGGVSAHSSSYSRSIRSPSLRGPEGGAGERAGGETEAKTPPSSACALGALYNGGGGGGGGRQRRRKLEAGGGGALTERAAARAPALAVQE